MTPLNGRAPSPSRRALVAVVVLVCLTGLGLFALLRTAGRSGLPPGGDFTLASAGGPFALRDLRGKVVLLFFGFVHCPGVCPAKLVNHAAAFELLRPEERERVAGLFVSVDPERDTPAAVQEYAGSFHPRIRGVTGPQAELREIARRYGVLYARQPADASGRYSVDHTSDTFVVAADGRLTARLVSSTSPESLAAELRRWLQEPPR